MPRPIVEFRGVTRAYSMAGETVYALRDVSFTVEEGDFFAVTGASGSGKSTLLNVLGCLDRPSGGTYHLGGRDVSRLSDDELSGIRAKEIGFVFQSFNLLPQLSVLDNIEVPLFYQGIPPEEARARSRELASRVGLGDRLGHRPAQLSGGQQQRVAIARALVNEPLILLADEPTGNLDSASGAEVLRIFDELNRAERTILLVTHDETVAAHANKRLVLGDGRVLRLEEGIRA
ncbi:MAG TPA: ABC transporter ATP-binding protein [Planctomycetota bacterium]|jgi:putative ABC transport system ATP-binding protein|nr:ABC transporter ATP-binding protein [Planctomycetota bacterium]